MSEACFIFKDKIQTPMCDMYGRLALPQLFLLMQELPGKQQLERERNALLQSKGVFWALSRTRCAVSRPMERGESVLFRTWPGQPKRYVFSRYYEFEDERGEVVAKASSLWMLVSLNTREIAMPKDIGVVVPDCDRVPSISDPGKLAMDFSFERVMERKALYSDFDVNGHVNNSRYVSWICDLFPVDTYERRFISGIQVNFIHEIGQGSAAGLYLGREGDRFGVRGMKDGDTAYFEAEGEWSSANA